MGLRGDGRSVRHVAESRKCRTAISKYFDEWSERDLRDMIRRDRNHPSVIMWSIGNEIPEQGRPDGWQLAKQLTDIVPRGRSHAPDHGRLQQ